MGTATPADVSKFVAEHGRGEIHMGQPVNAFDLSREQQETASLLQRLLGSAIANRYVDFCRLAAGAFSLNVSRPMAAHALRELDSMLRGALEVPMEARAPETAEDAERIAEARKQLRVLGFEDHVIDRAARELKPRLNHKQQIRQIVSRLGLAPDGDIANLWTSLTENFGGAHQRSFHRSLQVDDDFREKYQLPFDTVIRAVAVALQGRPQASGQTIRKRNSRCVTAPTALLRQAANRRLAAASREAGLVWRATSGARRGRERRNTLSPMARRKLPLAHGEIPERRDTAGGRGSPA